MSYDFFQKVDPQSKKLYMPQLVEHRVQMHDDRLDLMGLSQPKELSYLNIASDKRDFPASGKSDVTVLVSLSRRVSV